MGKQKTESLRKAISRQLLDADFGDERLSERLSSIVNDVIDRPGDSFPQVMDSDADLEGAYRFLRNENVTFDKIVEPHFIATAARMMEPETLCIHDTTDFDFSWHEGIEDMGILPPRKQGFYGHFAFACTLKGAPIGVIGAEPIFRYANKTDTRISRNWKEKENYKWVRMVDRVHQYTGGTVNPIHVMDREADVYSFFADFTTKERRFVIRLGYERKVIDSGETRFLFETTQSFPVLCRRETTLSKKKPIVITSKRKKNPGRKERVAELSFSVGTVEMKKPVNLRDFPATLILNVVRAFEKSPPEGETPVEWLLVTSEKVSTPEEALRVVDIYRHRWLIEEYFKALKTGCAYEERQLESKKTLLNALAIFIPVAVTLLQLRALSRLSPDLPATAVLTHNQIKLLKAISTRVKLPETLCVRQALLAIAGLGGHIKNNGDPGWIVLGRGYSDLMLAELGWNAALQKM